MRNKKNLEESLVLKSKPTQKSLLRMKLKGN